MSIDLNWETLTGGPDGAELAERIRDFIHVKFQSVPLPRFIKSVAVHEFDFGSIPPSVVLKDLCDPLPDFYEEEYDDNSEGDDNDNTAGNGDHDDYEGVPDAVRAAERRRRAEMRGRLGEAGTSKSGTATPSEGFFPPQHAAGLRSSMGTPDLNHPFLGLSVSTPGIPGGPSTMHYFQSKLGSAWSGAQTPLAPVSGAQHLNNWMDMTASSNRNGHPFRDRPLGSTNSGHARHFSQSSVSVEGGLAPTPHPLREKHSVSTLAPTSAGTSRPPTRDAAGALLLGGSAIIDEESEGGGGIRHTHPRTQSHSNNPHPLSNITDAQENGEGDSGETTSYRRYEPRPDDMQAVFRIRYAGDVRLALTAEILLDYPMPSFVGIPLKLNITGLTFDGVGVVAHIRRRVHFCFLSPEDAVTAIGDDVDDDDEERQSGARDSGGRGVTSGAADSGDSGDAEKSSTFAGGGKARVGGLLQEIRVESEIGQREGTKQSLKNVGKVEKFVLEQVRRIFEEEFVYPSFWTFLV
ncbi:hypothetical protein F5Y16DRAFT_361977 [Xylariaceae sp. FL0255]|nr:hypothetical protein F5Y16DRAFT_361977 [Xylariaceae sp. FL0255]